MKSFFFPHDVNAIQDPKMMTLLSECGLMGIGMFWIIIEILHQQEDGKITQEDFKRYLRFYYKCDNKGNGYIDKIEQVLNTSGLLLNKDGFVYSDRVLKNKEYRAEISQKRSYAGKKSAEIRLNQTSVEQNLTNVELLNKTKLNNTKQNKTKQNMFTQPTFEEVQVYCQERNNAVDPNQFIDFYASKNWMVGKNKMSDWKAALRRAEKWDTFNKPKKTALQELGIVTKEDKLSGYNRR